MDGHDGAAVVSVLEEVMAALCADALEPGLRECREEPLPCEAR